MKKMIFVLLSFLILLSGCTVSSNIKEVQLVEQTFKNINITVSKGTLSIISGDTFSYTTAGEESSGYYIEEDTLHIEKNSSGDHELVLPKNYSYDNITIDTTGGEITYKPVGKTNNLVISGDEGNITLSNATANTTVINTVNSYLYISGNLGTNVQINADGGYIKMKTSISKPYYNYVLDLDQTSYLNLDNYKYDALNVHEQVFNRSQNYMSITLRGAKVVVECAN